MLVKVLCGREPLYRDLLRAMVRSAGSGGVNEEDGKGMVGRWSSPEVLQEGTRDLIECWPEVL